MIATVELDTPTTLQRGIWLDQRLSANTSPCIVGGHLDILGPVDYALFQRGARQLTQRYSLLRVIVTQAHDEVGLPVQAYAEPFSVAVPLHGLLQETGPEAAALAWMKGRCTCHPVSAKKTTLLAQSARGPSKRS